MSDLTNRGAADRSRMSQSRPAGSAGAADEHRAVALAAGGLDVAVVERELVAGKCSYYACIPVGIAVVPLCCWRVTAHAVRPCFSK